MILVTGGTGLVGIHLLMELTANTTQPIRAIYREKKKIAIAQKLFLNVNPYENSFKNWEKIEWIKADITEIPSLQKAFKTVTEVYHCAGYISFDTSKFNTLKKVNIEGTANMVNLSLSVGVQKFCHVSSIATLNINPGETKMDEASQWNTEQQNSVYAISKFGGEMEVMRSIQEGLNAVIVNPGVIIGEGFYNSGSGLIFKNVQKGLPYFTPGITGYIGIRDTVKIMCKLMDRAIFGERFILVSKNLPSKKVIDFIATALNVKAPKKEIDKIWVKLYAYLQVFKSKFTRKSPKLSMDMANSLFEKSRYDNTKIITSLNWIFEPIEIVIKRVAEHYKLP